jgi:hypothetical protein
LLPLPARFRGFCPFRFLECPAVMVSTDKRSGIVNDPNRADDPEYVVRLIGQVITVSLETMKIVKSLPDLGLPAESQAAATACPS